MTAIFRVQSGPSIIFPSVLQRCLVKTSHGFAGRRNESDVETFARYKHPAWPQLDRKLVTSAGETIANRCFVCPNADVAQRAEYGIVERGRSRKISNREREMVQHMHIVSRFAN